MEKKRNQLILKSPEEVKAIDYTIYREFKVVQPEIDGFCREHEITVFQKVGVADLILKFISICEKHGVTIPNEAYSDFMNKI